MLDGDWQSYEGSNVYQLRLGKVFTATIEQRGGDGCYAKCWIGTLNGEQIADTNDLEYAKPSGFSCGDVGRLRPRCLRRKARA